MTDRWLHYVGQRECAEAVEGLAPALQVAGRCDGGWADRILAPNGVHGARCGLGVGCVSGWPGRKRRRALVVDHDVPAVSQPNMCDATTEDAHHHWLDHCQDEESANGGID